MLPVLRKCCYAFLIDFLPPIDPPNVSAVEPSIVLVNYSQMANFTCQAFGIPLPSLRWVKEADGNAPVNITDAVNITERNIPPFTVESVLTFSNTTKANESLYLCEGTNGVTNIIGSPEEANVTLFVDGMQKLKLP